MNEINQLRCKPGDTCIILAGINSGKLCTVIEASPGNVPNSGKLFTLRDQLWLQHIKHFCWVIEALPGNTLFAMYKNSQANNTISIMPDKDMMPLPKSSANDEIYIQQLGLDEVNLAIDNLFPI